MNTKIDSDKVFIDELFSKFWFNIPNYQRAYVWGSDEISELLDDIYYSAENSPADEYFLGSLVLRKENISEKDLNYDKFDVLDGQQRLTTLLLILGVIRDITSNKDLKESCNQYIYQKENTFRSIPERLRILFEIRDDVGEFINNTIKHDNGTLNNQLLKEAIVKRNVSISNMAKGILYIRKYFENFSEKKLQFFSTFLFTKVLLIYVATEELQDAFRLFTILNNRGIPLTNSDILKAENLALISNVKNKNIYAEKWEEIEGNFGTDEFDRLLSHIRTILLKDKARENILKEFEEKIFKGKKPILNKGEEAIKLIIEYSQIYENLIYFNNTAFLSTAFKNLITIMKASLPSTDWIPPLLAYYKKFKDERIFEFLTKLDNKFTADWVLQTTPTIRLQSMTEIIKKIEKCSRSVDLIRDPSIFSFNVKDFKNNIIGDIYNKKFSKYLLLKLEFLNKDNSAQFLKFDHISVEHILPQNPKEGSQWKKDFSDEEHLLWVNKIGNLVLLSRRKNSSLGRLDFSRKKNKYFEGNIDSFPNSLKVMQNNRWTVSEISTRQSEEVKKIVDYYKK